MIYFEKLEKNVIDVIKEEQLKLGYMEESIHLYYPLQSLNRLLKTEMSIDEMQDTLSDYFMMTESVFRKVQLSHVKDRFCLLIPQSIVAYVHEHTADNEFIREFIQTIGKHDCTIETLLGIFQKHGSQVYFEKKAHDDFDYLIYFVDGKPDDYRYCITDEGCHLIYHRFTQDDYKDFIH